MEAATNANKRARLIPAGTCGRLMAGLLAGATPAALAAQSADIKATGASRGQDKASSGSEDDSPDIVVTGQRQRGAVIGDIPPEVQIGPAEIRSYGVSSVADLLAELTPQTNSIRGRGGEAPVVLLNGRRISSLSEIRDIPTEAILRVDILPEEVALKYGYSADQRVVNFVLRPRFRAITGELSDRAATEGGGNNVTGDTTLIRINRTGRFNLALNYQATDPLLESQRNIQSATSSRPYDLTGNVTGLAGSEIDPALSALAGQAVTVAGVPGSAALGSTSLADFAARANTPNVTDLTPFRTLQPRSRQFTANAVLNRTVFGNVSVTVNGRVGVTDSVSRLGLPGTRLTLPADNPFSPFANDVELDRYSDQFGALDQRVRGLTGHLGLTLNRDIAHWRLSFTGTYDRSQTRTLTDSGLDTTALQAALDAGDPTLNPFGVLPADLLTMRGRDRATATSDSGGGDFVASGPLLSLPAGAVTTSIKLGAAASDFRSRSLRSGIAEDGDIDRQTVDGQVNLDVPLTSRRKQVLAAIGDLSVNANVAVNQLSDFGTLTTIGYGLHWSPIVPLSLIVSVTDDDGAPTAQQLGNPVVVTPDVRVFDYAHGQTVDVSRIDGGNPNLRSDNRHVTKFGLTLKPKAKTDLIFSVNYVQSRIRNAIAAFPTGTATPEIEAAFPDRFVRDASGQLLEFDSRPVNFAREDRRDLRLGINFSKPLKSANQERFAAFRQAGGRPSGEAGGDTPPGGTPTGTTAAGDRPAAGERGSGGGPGSGGPGGGPGGGGPGGGGGGRGGGGARLQLAVYYTLHLRDEVLIRDGVPVLDLLNGSATGSSGGQPRHEVQAQAGFSRNGLGARLSANWQSGTVVDGSGSGGIDDNLRFSGLATADLRLFSDLGQLPGLAHSHPWVRGMRVTVALTNLLDSRLRVRDATGATPISYQPDLLNPLGRTVKISLRKLFF